MFRHLRRLLFVFVPDQVIYAYLWIDDATGKRFLEVKFRFSVHDTKTVGYQNHDSYTYFQATDGGEVHVLGGRSENMAISFRGKKFWPTRRVLEPTYHMLEARKKFREMQDARYLCHGCSRKAVYKFTAISFESGLIGGGSTSFGSATYCCEDPGCQELLKGKVKGIRTEISPIHFQAW